MWRRLSTWAVWGLMCLQPVGQRKSQHPKFEIIVLVVISKSQTNLRSSLFWYSTNHKQIRNHCYFLVTVLYFVIFAFCICSCGTRWHCSTPPLMVLICAFLICICTTSCSCGTRLRCSTPPSTCWWHWSVAVRAFGLWSCPVTSWQEGRGRGG